MRRAILGLLLLCVAVAGAGCPATEGDLMALLEPLGPLVCSVYDFDGDGQATVDELKQIFPMFPDAELEQALEFYGCTNGQAS